MTSFPQTLSFWPKLEYRHQFGLTHKQNIITAELFFNQFFLTVSWNGTESLSPIIAQFCVMLEKAYTRSVGGGRGIIFALPVVTCKIPRLFVVSLSGFVFINRLQSWSSKQAITYTNYIQYFAYGQSFHFRLHCPKHFFFYFVRVLCYGLKTRLNLLPGLDRDSGLDISKPKYL